MKIRIFTWVIAPAAKSTQKGAVLGKMDSSLGHESFVFSAHRAFMNTLENIPAMLGTCFLAVLIGVNPFWAAVFIWAFVAARIIHMTLYYLIATEKNPSPRSYFFMVGLLANLGLFSLCLITLGTH
jgi:uncharacterized MAPEG superfamily protein